MALSPSLSPSTMPAARARTFFTAPQAPPPPVPAGVDPEGGPGEEGLTRRARSSGPAATLAVGRKRATSSAWLGPERATTGLWVRASTTSAGVRTPSSP